MIKSPQKAAFLSQNLFLKHKFQKRYRLDNVYLSNHHIYLKIIGLNFGYFWDFLIQTFGLSYLVLKGNNDLDICLKRYVF
ncbi:hypothetical protein BGP_1830 [Beggiatoa sp. PS]|nr:hypothetical protein BGP_1830 [Beggiatoa sp. PS]